MKKKILFAAIALVTLLAFTGCDKILEFMFPDSTSGDEWGQNSIEVQITILDPDIDYIGVDVYVQLTRYVDGESVVLGESIRVTEATVPWDDPEAIAAANVRYDGLTDGEYSAKVWLNVNTAFGADDDDPQTDAKTQSGQIKFIVGESQRNVKVFADLQALIVFDPATPFLYVTGRDAQSRYDLYLYFDLDSTIEYRNYDQVNWEFYYDDGFYGQYITGGTSYGNTLMVDLWSGYYYVYGYTYPPDGTYYLKITNATSGGVVIEPWQLETEIRLVEPAPSYYTMWPDVAAYGFDSPPFNLGDFDTSFEFYDYYGTYVGGGYVPGYGGSVYASGYYYGDPVPTMYLSIPDTSNAGRVRIYVDKNADGNYYGTEDVAAEYQMYLSTNAYYDGSYYLPYFEIDIGRFLPVDDFHRIFGF